MKNWFRQFYDAIPVVREFHRIKALLNGMPGHMRLMEATAIIQTLEAIKAGDERYRDPKRLMIYGAQYWSQNYEDGMIAEIFQRIGITDKTFVEIGVGDGSENNTTALLTAGWSGWWIDGDEQYCQSIAQRLQQMPATVGRLKVKHAFVTPDHIGELFSQMGVPAEVDLFSLDIDLNTYHIWAALRDFRPRVVVVEYNAGISPTVSWIHPYEQDKFWDYTQDQGASLKAYELLGMEFGYSLVGCDIIGLNAFFIRNDLVEEKFKHPYTSENHFEPVRYGLCYRWGHVSKFYT